MLYHLNKEKSFVYLIFVFAILLAYHKIYATVTMKIPFSDHMVLQRNAKVNVWGTGASGEVVTVKFNGQTKTVATGTDKNWKIQLDPMLAAGPLTMTVTGTNTITFSDVYVGEVWQCGGQSNMDLTLTATDWGGAFDIEVSKADYPKLRYMKTRKGNGTWNVMSPSTAGGCSATGYFFGKDLLQNLDCAVGLMVTAVGGTTIDQWFDPVSLGAFQGKLDGGVTPGDMYDQFVKPVVPYTIKGMVWIQGEQNASKVFGASDYGDRFKAVITNWRKAWGQGDFPFYYGQITGVNTTQATPFPNSAAAQVREGQRQALALPQTAMSVMLDISGGGWHYKNKQEAGRRLALAPKALLYGKNLEYSGPVFESATVSGSNVTVNFTHAKGLKTNNGSTASGIAVAGKDGVWYFVDKVAISGTSVLVSSTKVAAPVRVCMGWNDRPRLNLYNGDGLQASPFLAVVSNGKPTDCAGVYGGTASLDICGRCVAGNTGKKACDLLTEAEKACVFKGVEETINTGFKGLSYVNLANEVNSSISFNVSAESNGTATLSFRYANGGTEGRPGQLSANGTLVATLLPFSTGASWADWQIAEIQVPVVRGVNKFKLSATAAVGLPNLDQIGFVGTGLSEVVCETVTNMEDDDASIHIALYPNPSIAGFNLYVPENSKIIVTNLQGIIQDEFKGAGQKYFGENYATGIYLVEVHFKNQSKIFKVSKN